ncbi:MAG: hypothetical protein N2Z75_02505 [Meiothermus sp.]|uniref:hypothetical protein n=1 Tax=Meiothermus sp. TaxID=1955249 RepID=UPI0025CC5DB5|nr:hypothetical protein [Meiothermus sp.]MCS7067054.1 hypothetical protein [Meiothermus sp.]MCX7600793.1 hypothetical protein [Meiothermus sp.]MDW8424535.1 hypothetical protein [Meiothermus sp.]
MSTLTDVDQPIVRENLHQLLKDAWIKLEQQPLEAAVLARRVEHLARRYGNNRAWAQSLFIWGVGSLYGGDAQEAIGLLSRALAVYRFLDDEQGQWSCLKAIALAWSSLGDAAQALETHCHANAFKRRAEFAAKAGWLRWFAHN